VNDTIVFDENAAEVLGLDAMPGLFFAVPAKPHVVGVCLGCGADLYEDDDIRECRCWSFALMESLPSLMHTTCLQEATGEL